MIDLLLSDKYATTTTAANVNWVSYAKKSPDISQAIYDLDSFAPYDEPQVCNSVPCQVKTKGNKPMYVENDKHIESSKLNYLNDRLANVGYEKDYSLRKTFGLVNDDAPQSAEDLVKRIQDGKFILGDNAKKQNYDPVRYITWRDPSVKKDEAGYEAATKDFRKASKAAQDVVAIGTPSEGLAAIHSLEAWTPTVGKA